LYDLKVDVIKERCTLEPVRINGVPSGGRKLVAETCLDAVPPGCDPLGPDNVLVFCAGPLAGLPVSSAGRVSAGAKSPLTKGIKERGAAQRTLACAAR